MWAVFEGEGFWFGVYSEGDIVLVLCGGWFGWLVVVKIFVVVLEWLDMGFFFDLEEWFF